MKHSKKTEEARQAKQVPGNQHPEPEAEPRKKTVINKHAGARLSLKEVGRLKEDNGKCWLKKGCRQDPFTLPGTTAFTAAAASELWCQSPTHNCMPSMYAHDSNILQPPPWDTLRSNPKSRTWRQLLSFATQLVHYCYNFRASPHKLKRSQELKTLKRITTQRTRTTAISMPTADKRTGTTTTVTTTIQHLKRWKRSPDNHNNNKHKSNET